MGGLKISVLGLGTTNFGNKDWGCDEKTSVEIINNFMDKGGNFIDTACNYSGGESEKIIGRALSRKRDKVILSTKCGDPLNDATINERGSSRYNIIRSVEGSLKRLNTDYVDLLYLHFWDPTTPIFETLTTLTSLVRQGKVRYLGASNFFGWQISEAASYWKNQSCIEPFVSIQNEYNLMSRLVEFEIIPACIYNNLGLVCWSPLGGGALAGAYDRNKSRPKGKRYTSDNIWSKTEKERYLTEKNFRIIEKIRKIAVDLGTSLPALCIAWCIHKPGVRSALIGPKKTSQLSDNIKAAEIIISDEIIQKMDDISNPFESYESYEYDGKLKYLKKSFLNYIEK